MVRLYYSWLYLYHKEMHFYGLAQWRHQSVFANKKLVVSLSWTQFELDKDLIIILFIQTLISNVMHFIGLQFHSAIRVFVFFNCTRNGLRNLTAWSV
jgi:hypothetical protein